jgi:hypothetical protein
MGTGRFLGGKTTVAGVQARTKNSKTVQNDSAYRSVCLSSFPYGLDLKNQNPFVIRCFDGTVEKYAKVLTFRWLTVPL